MRVRSSFDWTRAALAVVAAAGLATVVGTFQQGSIAGGLGMGLIVGVGVAIGLVVFELASQYLE